ncbi:MAG TPA: hypothetical protein VNG89_03640 [Vicinamibacterales bacterium]|nr:hypothetical protein [Vicinamibacterales bacterium]
MHIVSPLATTAIVAVLMLVWLPTVALIKREGASHAAQRLALAVAVGTTAAVLAWTVWSQPQPQVSDLAEVWAGARALVHGGNPYQAVGPGRAFNWPYPLLYPMTAVVTLGPLAWLPLRVVDPLFVAFGFGLFTFGVTGQRLRTPALVALVSVGGLMTLQTSQWSLLLTGAALVPAFGWLLAAKPTIGLALFAAFPRRSVAIGCVALLGISVLVQPLWIVDWRATFASAPHVVAPLTRAGGPLLLLALAKWKRADARLLLGMACVPHTTVPYETIPLFLIPQTWTEAWGLWACGLLAYAGQWATGPYASQDAYWAGGARWIVMLMYLPCLAMVLRRPNVESAREQAPEAVQSAILGRLLPTAP